MTIESFENSFENQKSSKKLFYKILCSIAIIVSLFLAYAVFVNQKSKGLLLLAAWLLILGLCGLFELRKHYKITYIENNLSEEQNIENIVSVIQSISKGNFKQNENSFEFIYQKSWWRMDYKITVLGAKNLIALNAEGRGSSDSGFIDFGASKRTEKNIINLINENASRSSIR